MRILDIVAKKRDGSALTQQEIEYLVGAFSRGEFPDYQMSSWLMAVYLKGMTFEETGYLTRAMIESGATIDLSKLSGPFIDKHSTGGVGDKTSLILAPIVAECGVKIPMMSGRSLGHTGGTLDKLDSIPGYQTRLQVPDFVRILEACHFAMTGQTNELVPADRLMYALRDASATVESIPLITASILSKKFAEGAQGFVFDVKTGSGAFMKTLERSKELARSLVKSSAVLGRKAVALITDMDFPLGWAIGNFLEVEESIDCLDPEAGVWKVEGSGDLLTWSGPSGRLMELSMALSAHMLCLARPGLVYADALEQCLHAVNSGRALERFYRNVTFQGGDTAKLKTQLKKRRAPFSADICANSTGFVNGCNSYMLGVAGIGLGVGRNTSKDQVLPDTGYIMHVQQGQEVRTGRKLCTVYAQTEAALQSVVTDVEKAFVIEERYKAVPGIVKEVIK